MDRDVRTIRVTGGVEVFLQQIRHHWVLSLLLFLALCGVAVLHTYVRNSADYQHRSMQLIMKNMGHNLWFLDESADPLDAIVGSDDLPTFADDRIYELAGDRRVASTYWANALQGMVQIQGRRVLLTGVHRVDDYQITAERPHLLEVLSPGEARLGHNVAADWDLVEGDMLSVEGRRYYVVEVYRARGTIDDHRLWIPLGDAQQWLGKPGRANLILGFLCMRGMPLDAGLARLGDQIADHHAGFQVIPRMNMLEARSLARATTAQYLSYLLMIVLIVTAALIAIVGWMEVKERRYELSIMLAMGTACHFLIGLVIGKLVALALAASLIGFLIGSYCSVYWLSPHLLYETQPITIVWDVFPKVLATSLILMSLAAVVPLVNILRLDPARMLSEE